MWHSFWFSWDLRNCDLEDDVIDICYCGRTSKDPRAAGPFETIRDNVHAASEGGSAQLHLCDVRCLFDKLLNKYPMLVRHLGDTGAIVANAEFERGIMK